MVLRALSMGEGDCWDTLFQEPSCFCQYLQCSIGGDSRQRRRKRKSERGMAMERAPKREEKNSHREEERREEIEMEGEERKRGLVEKEEQERETGGSTEGNRRNKTITL